MRSRVGRWIWWLVGLVGVGLALRFFTGFPWNVTFATLLNANRWLLLIALVVNLSSLVAKGWGWHVILKTVAPHSWRVAQEANLVGAAVNDLSVAVAGEAARVHLIVQRGGVTDPLAEPRVHPDLLGEQGREAPDPLDVGAGVLVPELHRHGQPAHGLGL